MENYKISVIVPVYNVENYIKKCVDSLINQTYRNIEIVLVDDGSQDRSGKICDELSLQDERIKVVHKENGGLISAWKRGVSESGGEYLNFLDSDDWVDLNMFEEMAVHLTGDEREIIVSDYIIERDNGSSQYVYQQLTPGIYDRAAIEKDVIPYLLGRESRYITISRCMKLIARRLIEENGKYSDPRVVVGEDTTVMLPSLIDCNRLVVMDHKAYYHYLYVQESMVHKYNKGLLENIRLLKQTTEQILRDKFGTEILSMQLRQLDKEYVFWLMLVLKNEARGNPEGYRENIVKLCKSEEVRTLLKTTPVTVEQTANKLLYFVMKRPNILTVTLLRMAMLWYYRK